MTVLACDPLTYPKPANVGQPTISVVIPAFNRARTIRRTLLSVATQSHAPLEIIVVDDGSSDDTEEVIAAMQLNNLRFIKQKNSGANAARNRGASEASGELIAFQDSDDFWSPDKLEKQVAALRDHEARGIQVCFCQVLEYGGDASKLFPFSIPQTTRIFSAGDIAATGILTQNIISTQTLIIRRDAFADVGGFDIGLPRFQDWELAIRLVEKFDVLYLAETLAFAEKGPDAITRNYKAGLRAREAILTKHRSLFDRYPAARSTFRRQLLVRKIAGAIKSR